MPEPVWILIFSVLVVIALFLFRKYVTAVEGLSALFLTILACVIAAAIHTFIIEGTIFSGAVAGFIIYAVSNLIFQIVSKARGQA